MVPDTRFLVLDLGIRSSMPSGTITALRVQEHDRQRVNVFVDDTFAIGISLDTLAREELYVGKTLDADAWADLETAESADKAFSAALRYLETRPRSIAEVRERLRRKQFAPATIEAALARLIDLNLLNDAAFSQFWIENRQACRPRGIQALRQELYRKGIERDIIDATLSDRQLTGDEDEQALTLARAALRKYARIPDYLSFQRRLGGYLQRRGFGFETIKPILEMLWQELQRDDVSRKT